MNIIFIAPPSAGKGTVSSKLVDNHGFLHLSTSDLLREEIRKGTNLGNDLKKTMESGQLVSNDIINELVAKKIGSLKESKFILDGYPRNHEQALVLDKALNELEIDNYLAIYLDVDFDELVRRVSSRIACKHCGKTFNLDVEDLKPKVEGICDSCGEELIIRADDSIETFTKRYNQFKELTEPIIEFYKDLDKLVVVNGNNSSDEAYNNILDIIGEN